MSISIWTDVFHSRYLVYSSLYCFHFVSILANYNADEDEYLTKRNGKAFHEATTIENTIRPICEQPGRQEDVLRYQHFLFCYSLILNKSNVTGLVLSSNINSSKIREEDYRQIQTNVPFLAPEILAVFQNSQIFHDHQPSKSLAIVHKSPSHHDDMRRHSRSNSGTEKNLLKRLEGNGMIHKSNRNSRKWFLSKFRHTIPIVWNCI